MKIGRTYLVLIVLLPLFAFTSMHKFYVSVTQVNYVKNEQAIQMTSRLFIDDIEISLRKHYGDTLTLTGKYEPKIYDDFIEAYLRQNILIKINGKKVNLTYIGKAYEGDIMQCYLEIEGVKNIQSIEISNSILFDDFKEQQNIIKTNINSKQKSVIQTNNDYTTTFKF